MIIANLDYLVNSHDVNKISGSRSISSISVSTSISTAYASGQNIETSTVIKTFVSSNVGFNPKDFDNWLKVKSRFPKPDQYHFMF